MTTKRSKKPPPWFNLADYEATAKLDFRGWAIMLWARRYYRDALSSSIKQGRFFKGAFDSEGYWDAYFGDTRLANAEPKSNSELPSGLGPPRSIPLDELTDAITNTPVQAAAMMSLDISAFGLRVLTVDLQAADPILHKAFQDWLTTA